MTALSIPESQVLTSRPAPSVELHGSLPSKIEAISPFLEQLMSFIAVTRVADGSESYIEGALCEALMNAVVHGNHEDPQKRVFVECRCSTGGEVWITVRDEGPGFDLQAVKDPTSPENRLLPHGRGIYLMRALMDEVSFKQGGAVVQMRKHANNPSALEYRGGK